MSSDHIKLGEAQALRVITSSPDALELESTWTSSTRKPPPHYHPSQDEHFEVLEGELMVELDHQRVRTLRAGDTLDVPRGTVHRMWNESSPSTRATWRVTPALRTEEMFRFMDAGLSPLRMARLLWTFRKEYRLGLRLGRQSPADQ